MNEHPNQTKLIIISRPTYNGLSMFRGIVHSTEDILSNVSGLLIALHNDKITMVRAKEIIRNTPVEDHEAVRLKDIALRQKKKKLFIKSLRDYRDYYKSEPSSVELEEKEVTTYLPMIRAYMRASTEEQDATRSKGELIHFMSQHNKRIAAFYSENKSGAGLDRPELDKLIDDSVSGDVLLIEKVDRLSRLPFDVWKTLKARIQTKGIQIVVLDQPMTHGALVGDGKGNAITQALTEFMLDLGAAMARDDYETRQKRQAQGIAKAKIDGKYKGKQENTERNQHIMSALQEGKSYKQVMSMFGCSRDTVARMSKRIKEK